MQDLKYNLYTTPTWKQRIFFSVKKIQNDLWSRLQKGTANMVIDNSKNDVIGPLEWTIRSAIRESKTNE